ncbi:MAG: SRPBCC domain-containing protein [Pseudohongiellaceae bacterium]
MSNEFEQSIAIRAPAELVWAYLSQVELMKAWMSGPEMGLEIETDWKVGAPITMRGFHHTSFTNTGKVLAFNPETRLVYTHLSSLSRLPEEPESYVTFEFILIPEQRDTILKLKAIGSPTMSIFKHLEFYWRTALETLKQHVQEAEKNSGTGNVATFYSKR